MVTYVYDFRTGWGADRGLILDTAFWIMDYRTAAEALAGRQVADTKQTCVFS